VFDRHFLFFSSFSTISTNVSVNRRWGDMYDEKMVKNDVFVAFSFFPLGCGVHGFLFLFLFLFFFSLFLCVNGGVTLHM